MSSLKEFVSDVFDRLPGLEDLDPGLRKIVISVIFCLIMLLILTINMLPIATEFVEGESSPAEVISPRDINVLDRDSTETRRQLALDNVEPVYTENISALEISRSNFTGFLTDLQEIWPPADSEQVENILNEYGISLTEEEFEYLLNLTAADLDIIKQQGEEALELIYLGPVRENELSQAQDRLNSILEDEDISNLELEFLTSLIMANLSPNLAVDEQATESRHEEVLAGVEPVYVSFSQGDVIVEEGETISRVQSDALEDLDISAAEIGWFRLTGTVVYFIIITMVIVYYIKNHLSSIWNKNNKLYLLEFLTIIIFIMAWILSIIDFEYIYYLLPVGMLSVLTTILLSTAPAVIVTIYVSLLLPILFNSGFELAVVAFISGMVGCYSVTEIDQRSDLVKAGFNISGVLIFTVIMLSFMRPAHTLFDLVMIAGIGGLNGLLVAILANGLLPYLENMFNLTSAVKLLELSNPNQPLLKRLLVEAPGTYHHSMVVGNLAETAADNIGADALLTRVGAYYHDIGKLKRPYFFTDNQFGGNNPHDDINPNLSSLIIKSHVKDGVKMARKHDLPEDVIDIIEQHQGTNLISYFYQEAIHNNDHTVAEESDFRYDGPKPQTKEAAILMLADIVEAAIRSKNFDKTNPNRIENVVRGLIREKLLENQLDESDLTLKELNTIAESFSTILTGIYHQRVEYPDDLEQELEELEGKNDAQSNDKESD